jgi:hypothetical protein
MATLSMPLLDNVYLVKSGPIFISLPPVFGKDWVWNT